MSRRSGEEARGGRRGTERQQSQPAVAEMNRDDVIKILFRLDLRAVFHLKLLFRAMSNRNMIKISRSVSLAVVSSS
jgi:hypothetical protein